MVPLWSYTLLDLELRISPFISESILRWIRLDASAEYLVRIIEKFQIKNIKAVASSLSAVDDLKHIQVFMPRTVGAGIAFLCARMG